MPELLVLGESESRYGQLATGEALPGVAWALSVGADPRSPSLQFNGNKSQPNEDGLLVAWDGSWTLLAVADGHLGQEGSHTLLRQLSELHGVPRSRGELALAATGLGDPPWPGLAGTTLLVACLDRQSGRAFGFSWGDSRVCRLSQTEVDFLNQGNPAFLRPGPAPDPAQAEFFQAQLESGDLLLLFTDGVNECHYRSPLTSVRPADLVALSSRHPAELVRELGRLALDGVRGKPGGQDNLAIVAASTTIP